MASLWGLLMALGVLLGGRTARAESAPEVSAEPAPQSRFESAFAALSTSLSATFAATFDRGVSEAEPEARPEPAPMPPAWLAGLCDARGASAIAPLPLITSRDGVVQADESCPQGQTLQAGVSFEQREIPASSVAQDALDPGILPTILPLAIRAEPRLLPRLHERLLVLPRGFGQGIDEPPRALARPRRWPDAWRFWLKFCVAQAVERILSRRRDRAVLGPKMARKTAAPYRHNDFDNQTRQLKERP